MSQGTGGPPHSHGRPVAPPSNTGWNHLQVPNYYPRQPQHAHMSNEHPLLHQPAWHTPTTDSIKSTSHSHIYNLEQTVTERPYAHHSPGIDLTLQRNGSQNGEHLITPMSLSVRDTNKINSLPASAIQAVELTKYPSMKSAGFASKPTTLGKLPNTNSSSPVLSPGIIEKPLDSHKNLKRVTKSMDSIIERLNPASESRPIETSVIINERTNNLLPYEKNNQIKEKTPQSSVIVQPPTTAVHDESSNSSSIVNVPTPTNIIDEDVVSPFSNEDSTDSNKSRRKRKPFKTMRLSKEAEIPPEQNYMEVEDDSKTKDIQESNSEQRRSESAPPGKLSAAPLRSRRKTSSESETIANITAMVQKTGTKTEPKLETGDGYKPISVSVIKSNDNILEVLSNDNLPIAKVPTPAQKKMTETKTFVEVENQLEEMFAGLSDDIDKPLIEQHLTNFSISKNLGLDETKSDDNLKLDEDNVTTNHLQESVSSTSNELNSSQGAQKRTRKKTSKVRYSTESMSEESSPKRTKGSKKATAMDDSSDKANLKKIKGKLHLPKSEVVTKDAYDSGSNTSSIKSRGPFVHIRGPRESPLSVHIVNTSVHDDDVEKKSSKFKKYHDDGEYRHKVRSRGLHSSTLSNKYDSQTRDTTWICVFCKQGPHASNSQLGNVSLGDLFGPYLITCKSIEYLRHLDDPYDKQFKSKKVAHLITESNSKTVKKSKRKHSDSIDSLSSNHETDVYLGMTETEDKVYEVWAHEDCLVWSSGVYLVGPKIIGLEEAVWSTCNILCNKCNFKGANLCCVRRGCMGVMHYGCAVTSDWYLDVESYKVLCIMHKLS